MKDKNADTTTDTTLTLVVSGMLWQRSLVMKDRETGSLWSHLLGEAMAGPLMGTQLKTLPAAMTDWGTWKQKYPQTTVANLSRTSESFRRDMYARPEQFLVGLVDGAAARGWTFAHLQRRPVLNDQLNEVTVLIVFDKRSGAAWMYDREVDGRVLTFIQRGESIVDEQTSSTWDGLHMKAVEGPLAGRQLTPLPGIISFTRAWQTFHPESTYYAEQMLRHWRASALTEARFIARSAELLAPRLRFVGYRLPQQAGRGPKDS